MTLTVRVWTATAAMQLWAVAGCEDFNPPSPDHTVVDGGDEPLRDATVPPQDAGDAQPLDDGLVPCAVAEHVFQAFLATHRSCTDDADCTTVGDCGPFIVHEPVNVAGAEEAARLQRETCHTGYDGDTDGVACEDGVCVSVPGAGICCGCPDTGSFYDAGSDADAG